MCLDGTMIVLLLLFPFLVLAVFSAALIFVLKFFERRVAARRTRSAESAPAESDAVRAPGVR